jgi:release factor glutamine methyltransferase
MKETGGLDAARTADGAGDHGGMGHPALLHYDMVRRLFVETGLVPEPETYELFWLHVTGADPALSRAVEERMAAGGLEADAVKELRRRHLGDIAAAEVLALLEATQASATHLAGRLERGHEELKAYDAEIAAGDEALAVARGNGERLGLGVRFVAGDWFSTLAGERFDVILANPPYIAAGDPHLGRGDLRFEPASALVAGADGLDDIRRIVAEAPEHLFHDGWLLLEHGYDQGAAVRRLLLDRGFAEVATRRDLGGNDRITGGRWPC